MGRGNGFTPHFASIAEKKSTATRRRPVLVSIARASEQLDWIFFEFTKDDPARKPVHFNPMDYQAGEIA